MFRGTQRRRLGLFGALALGHVHADAENHAPRRCLQQRFM
jgi:hypothetical protein